MMKKLVLFMLLLGLFSISDAQTFTVYPSNVVNTTLDARGSANVYIHFPNISSQPITFVWEVTNSSYPSQWLMQVCDNFLCYTLPHPIDTMTPVPPGDSGFLKMICIPMEVTGNSTISFHVYDMNNPSSEANVTYNFEVTSAVGISSMANEEEVSFSPSPANEEIVLNSSNGYLERGRLKVYDLRGQLHLDCPVNSVQSMTLDVQPLLSGIYLLRYEYKSGSVTKKVVVSH